MTAAFSAPNKGNQSNRLNVDLKSFKTWIKIVLVFPKQTCYGESSYLQVMYQCSCLVSSACSSGMCLLAVLAPL